MLRPVYGDKMRENTCLAAIDWNVEQGLVRYPDAVAQMENRVESIRDGSGREGVWLLEHPPLYTAGTSAKAQDLLEARFPVFPSGRGGQFTYHGPGQRIAYVMLDLDRPELGPKRRDVRCHVWRLEEWMIRTLARFNVKGERRDGRIGVVHGFVKKTQRTPPEDLALARRRMQEMIS